MVVVAISMFTGDFPLRLTYPGCACQLLSDGVTGFSDIFVNRAGCSISGLRVLCFGVISSVLLSLIACFRARRMIALLWFECYMGTFFVLLCRR